VYGWQPRAFTAEELAGNKSDLVIGAKAKLGNRLDPDYIGVSCDGEVGRRTFELHYITLHYSFSSEILVGD